MMTEMSDPVKELLSKVIPGRRAVDDPFFEKTYKDTKIFQRTGVTVEDIEDLCHDVEFPCQEFDCKETFHSLIAFATHCNSHRYICMECMKVRPTLRLFQIHIQEQHDSRFQLLAQKKPSHQCYVSECDIKFSNPKERYEHCISVHKLPKKFYFMLGGEKSEKTESGDAMEVDVKPKPTKK